MNMTLTQNEFHLIQSLLDLRENDLINLASNLRAILEPRNSSWITKVRASS